MTRTAKSASGPSSPTQTVVRLSGGRALRLIARPRKMLSALLVALLSVCLPGFAPSARALDAGALPTQGRIQVGSGQISQNGAHMVIQQHGQRLGIDWQTYSIGADGSVTYVQPGRDAVALNRVVGDEATQIYGRLNANGQVFLVNPKGVLFAPGAKVDVGGLVASSLDLKQDDFAQGRYAFQGGDAAGKVVNQGDIQAAAGGYVALFAPKAANEGAIRVQSGQVVLAGGRAVTVDITGSNLIHAVVQQGAADSRVDNSGHIEAPGGSVRLTARAAQDTVGGLVNNTGIVKAHTLVNKNGEIWLLGDSVANTGEVRAEGAAQTAGGRIEIAGAAVALGGSISADGADGGQIIVTAGQRLSLAENVSARGQDGAGGRIEYASGGGILESGSSHTDAGGTTDGGEIRVHAASGIASSGQYTAAGRDGHGGRIDMTGHSVHLLSARLDASGATEGGLIRVGGAFQGGKDDAPEHAPEVQHLFVGRWEDTYAPANARTLFVNDGTSLDVGATGGRGGTVILWADEQTTFLGAIEARGASGKGGGAVEISAGDTLRRARLDDVLVGPGGHLLLDPKNLIIGDQETLKQWQYQAVLESVYAWKASVPVLNSHDQLGVAVALNHDATRMAVGAHLDDGAANGRTDSGAVHLFAFQDAGFNGGALVGTLGHGYLGGNNVNVALDISDGFGSAVALSNDARQLAVGAYLDDGAANNGGNAGAVHLFTFDDGSFAGGRKVGTIGHGYSGAGDINPTHLDGSDFFGLGVALSGDGRRLAVGAYGDDGAPNNRWDSGAVHLFAFDAGFENGRHVGIIGHGYAPNQALPSSLAVSLNNFDSFGVSVALSRDGSHLAVGAHADDGAGATSGDYGAVHLFTLDGDFRPTKIGTIGRNYGGEHDLAQALDTGDLFGRSVALNGDGTRLAVGAVNDDGAANNTSNTGAVYLYTFDAPGFSGGRLAATIGVGYTGADDIPITLRNGDIFGAAVALSADATRLAVGAPQDDGANNNLNNAGAVHLFTFADTAFGGGKRVGLVGQDYRNERGEGVALDGTRSAGTDLAGMAVALNANARLLAVGAPGDDGYGDNASNTGAVHLITFDDGDFTGARLAGSIGHGYLGAGNLHVDLDDNDEFGFGVALSGDGRHLAVGARYDDGAGNNNSNAGAVHLITFADAAFGGAQKVGTLGVGYGGAGNLHVPLVNGAQFGFSVALNHDGTRLAVGAPEEHGAGGSQGYSGAVRLFAFAPGFQDGAQIATLGHGYSTTLDPDNIALPLRFYDSFGSSVALSGDGRKLAVGAYRDDGAANNVTDAGAVHLFTFSDATGPFTGGVKTGTIGVGYNGAGDVAVALDGYDNFGRAVALNAHGTLLAVGASHDDGAGNVRTDTGAVHLFTFADSAFTGGALAGSIGHGYLGGRNVGIRLDSSDQFGTAVALNAAGDRLAVGAPRDDGANNQATNSGAVHLFRFNDQAFNGGRLAGSIGNGYVPDNALSLDLSSHRSWNGDQAGYAVALSADARQLAVGLPFDDGAAERPWDNRNYGAVHLITFADRDFGGGTLVGTLGKGYAGSKDIDIALDANDRFGAAVALSGDGLHLAVGAPYDDGANNIAGDSGAVRLFTFTDTAFSGGQLRATLGRGYTGGNDLSPQTGSAYNYYFGSAVALNHDGTRLAVGVPYDSGADYAYASGAVQLFTFNDDFSGGSLVGTIGRGYTTTLDPDNVPVQLDAYDQFGSSVALNAAGTLLAVGAAEDDGAGNAVYNSGAVRLFTFGAAFTGGTHVATLGAGYSGANDLYLPLSDSNHFGRSVALNAAGTQLAVGAPYDDGADDRKSDSGAVYLFTLQADGTAAALASRLGSGYAAIGGVEAGLRSGDYFGWSVALDGDGTRLAVGAPRDDGARNAQNDSGAVHLFAFDDSLFGGGRRLGRIGHGATAEKSLALPIHGSKYWHGEAAGWSVALSADARQLAIGAPDDSGGDEPAWLDRYYGAVHLVTFEDGDFGGGALAGTVGKGYRGGNNIDVPLDRYDQFGTAVALSGDGMRLVVGAPYDAGFRNTDSSAGAIHLFTFGDSDFSGGWKVGTIGLDYTGSNDLAFRAPNGYNLGRSLALNHDGSRLAAGDPYNSGVNNSASYAGAVHLFAFDSASPFGNGRYAGSVGVGFATRDADVNVNAQTAVLNSSDYFGYSVALDGSGNLLAVGAPYDDGQDDLRSNSGAVHLFSFTPGTEFLGAQHVGTIGHGYRNTDRPGNIDIALPRGHAFAYGGVALSGDGRRLVVGSPYDHGFDGTRYYSGAVRTFTFAAGLTEGALVGTLGAGYTGANDLNLTLPTSAYFGWAVALDGDGRRMAVGLPYDGGLLGDQYQAGAVDLFTFGADMTNPTRVGRVGRGYTGAASLDAPFTGYGYSDGDQLGTAVALSADARLLAIGAPGDAGAVTANPQADSGAVHLITFSDGDFNGATLTGTIGRGYDGGNNIAVALDAGDRFGSAVALSRDGRRLAVGAPFDDGYGNTATDSGAVYLFGFADTAFTGGALYAMLGVGYSGGKNLDLTGTVSAGDEFGQAVALDQSGSRLAVGAPADYGASGFAYYSGSVHLFTFSDDLFSGGARAATLGLGFTGGNDIDVGQDLYDRFGSSLALSADATRLAVGAMHDAGAGNTRNDAGAVHLFTFGDAFSAGTKVGTIGYGYGGAGNVAVPSLSTGDQFGHAVALDSGGTRLAVGASGADTSTLSNSGAVHLFTFGDGFTQGAWIGSLAAGYSSSLGVPIDLRGGDQFGRGVALSGDATRLVVGAPNDDGYDVSQGNAGVAYLFTFGDDRFADAQAVGRIGHGYVQVTRALDIPFVGAGSSEADRFGSSVALSGDARLLAVGAPNDAGATNATLRSQQGAVHLITFSDGNYGGASLTGTIGGGYSGGNNVHVALDAFDRFGSAVALSRDGRVLAVGAPYDDGAYEAATDSGAVHLFGFADGAFGGGQRLATLGRGYGGGNNVAVELDSGDQFGQSVALDQDGTRLAVGAPYDDGAGNLRTNSGAVYLFTFASGAASGTLAGVIGRGYTGGGDVDIPLDNHDLFGTAVALSANADLLAVGAPRDDGAANQFGDTGAVHLFGFGDAFAAGRHVASVGKGYAGTQDVAIQLGGSDNFGQSVALNAAGTRLAVGAPYDDGAYRNRFNTGAIHLFTFGENLSAGMWVGSIGADYAGPRDIHLPLAGDSDLLGWSVALNGAGDRLAAGLINDAGAHGTRSYAGAVKLFAFEDGAFNGGRVAGHIGYGYQTVSTALNTGWAGAMSYQGDAFGSAVAFDGSGTLLAVGAPRDDGFRNGNPGSGAVYLFQFGGSGDAQASLLGIVGSGYRGGRSIDVALDPNDAFGSAVALTADGRMMAVGAPNDDGHNNRITDSGAVHLFQFGNGAFQEGVLTGTLGYGYAGVGSLAVDTLAYVDRFGSALALSADGTRLAVGAPLDKGAAKSIVHDSRGYGAVHLFRSDAGAWQRTGVIGFGYTGAGSLDMGSTLHQQDNFGSAVALDGAGTLLAVGAPYDDGHNDARFDAGAVHLFTLGDDFSMPARVGTIGFGYVANLDNALTTDDSHFNLATLDFIDYFGSAVALTRDGRRLAVGAPYDDGGDIASADAGAVHLFGFADDRFATPARLSTLGVGYGTVSDLQQRIGSYDHFGSAVAFSADGARLAVGMPGDDGAGNGKTDSGAVRIFTFADDSFTLGFEIAALGDGRLPANVSFPTITTNDRFGAALALSHDATRLAVGAPGDDGFTNDRGDAGAVHLFSFSDGDFSGAALRASIGFGYSGGNNIGLELGWADNFGAAVALNADATLLAVGSPRDDGAHNDRHDAGAVHLFRFADGDFGAGARVGTLGYGHAGGNDVGIARLDTQDAFGTAVALSGDGRVLVVGAPGDDGSSHQRNNSGAVYRFAFGNDFTGGTLTGLVGHGYTGTADIHVALDGNDEFGRAVALNGDATLLAVGAPGDDGQGNSRFNTGAVHLFTLDGGTGGTRVGTIGFGYDSPGDIALALDASDQFGGAVALDAQGGLLAVGAPGDDGAGNSRGNAGAVYLLRFADTAFGMGRHDHTLGHAYTSFGEVNTPINANDAFGSAVALGGDGNRLAVGAPGHDLSGGYTLTDTGRVQLFSAGELTADNDLSALAFADRPGDTVALLASEVASLLVTGTAVTLQANNDLVLASHLRVPGDTGGALTLMAGRRVLLNGDIVSANGDVLIQANTPVAQGTVAAQRDAGAALLAMASGTRIDGGDGTVTLRLADGAGLGDSSAGNITLGDIQAAGIVVENLGAGSGAGVMLNGRLNATGDIVVATTGGNVTNNRGADALASGEGRWLLYTGDWWNSLENGLVAAAGGDMPRLYDRTYAGAAPDTIMPGNHLIYRSRPTLTLHASSATKVYGDADPALAFQVFGLVNDDGVADTVASAGLGDPTVSLPVVADPTRRAAGTHAISIAYTDTGTNAGYAIQVGAGNVLTVTPRPLVLLGLSVDDKVYDGGTAAVIANPGTLSGLLSGDDASVQGIASAAFADRHAGNGKTVLISGLSLTGTDAANYSVANLTATASILRKPITLTSFSAADKIYDGTTSATITGYGALDGLVGTETLVIASGSARFGDRNAGQDKTVTLTGIGLANGTGHAGDYVLTLPLPTTTATITPKPVHAGGTRQYDGTATVLAGQLSLLGIIGGDQVGLTGNAGMADKHVGTGKPLTFDDMALAGLHAGNYLLAGGTIDITPRLLSVTGMSVQNKIYDGTTVAHYSGTPVVGGELVANDDVLLAIDDLSVEFIDKHAGFGKALVATGLSLAGTDAPNYRIVVTDTATIAPRLMTIAAAGHDKVYDGMRDATVTYSDDRIAGDDLAILGTARFDSKHVGVNKPITVHLALSGPDAGNYLYNASATTSASITPRALNVTATAQHKVYDGTTEATVLFTDDRVAGDQLTLTSLAGFADRHAGVAKPITGLLGVTGADAGNYSYANTLQLAADITPKPLQADGTRVYDGTNLVAAADLMVPGIIAGDDAALTGGGHMADKHVGMAKPVTPDTLILVGEHAGNYALVGATIDITPRPLTVSGLSVLDKVYDATTDATFTGTPTLTGDWLPGDDIAVVPAADIVVVFADKHAGSDKTLVVQGGLISGADAHNYRVEVVGSASIAQRPLDLRVTALDRVYDGTSVAGLRVSDDRSGAMLLDDLLITASGSFADKHVGTDKPVAVVMNVTGSDAANYLFTPVQQASASITPRPLDVQATVSDRIYDGTRAAAVTLADDRIAGDQLAVTGVGEFADKHAGIAKSVLVTLAYGGPDLGNYSVVDSITTVGSILPRPLTFAGLGVLDKIYDGTPVAHITGGFDTVSGLIDGDDIAIDVGSASAVFADKHAGIAKPVSIVGVGLSGADRDNYTVQASAGTASILRKTLDVTGLTPSSKVYDGTRNAIAAGIPDVQADFIAGDDVALDLAGFTVEFADKHVGTDKPLFITGNVLTGADAANYEARLNTTASITPRPLTVTADVVDRIYDGSTDATVAFLDDRIAGDLLSINGTARFVDKHVGTNKPIQLADLALSGADAGNYLFDGSALTASASIHPRILLATGQRVYDGGTAIPADTLGFDNLVPGDDLSLSGGVTLVDKHVGENKPVQGGLALAGADAANYILSGLRYTVTPRALTVTGLSAQDKVYDGTTQATVAGSASIGLELVPGDEVFADLSTVSVAFLDKHVGTGKPLMVTGNVLSGADAGNYFALLDVVASITPRQLTLTGVGAQDKVYDGTTVATRMDIAPPALAGGVIAGDDLVLDLVNLAVAFADKNAGTGKSLVVSGASLGGSDAGNYRIAIADATASIAKAPLAVAIDPAQSVQRYYGDDNPIPSVIFTGFVAGEDAAIAGISGAPSITTAATATSPVGVYDIQLTLGDLDAQNYSFGPFQTGTLTVSPKPLTIFGNNVVRFAGEPDPDPYTWSTNVGGLVHGDQLQFVVIAPPAGSADAQGGAVFPLMPLDAVFAIGDPANYLLSYRNGWLLVLTKPDYLAGATDSGATPGFAVELIDPADIAAADAGLRRELGLQDITRRMPDAPLQLQRQSLLGIDPEEIRRMVERYGEADRQTSSQLIADLRAQPILYWYAGPGASMLNLDSLNPDSPTP